MRLVWKGKLTEENSFPNIRIPEDSEILLGDEEMSWKDYIAIIPILIIGTLSFIIKDKYISVIEVSMTGFLIGLGLSILFLVVHELIHGLFCTKNCQVNYYYSIYGITCYPLKALNRNRYITMALAPFFLLGILPLVVWFFIPTKLVMTNSILYSLMFINLSATTVDIRNAITALIKAPKRSFIQASGSKVYWFRNL